MSLFFSSQQSVVVVNNTPTVAAFNIFVYGNNAFSMFDGGLIPIEIKTLFSSNMQASPALSSDFYVFIFGALPFKLVVNGIMLRNVCSGFVGGQPLSEILNLARTVAAAYNPNPLFITISGSGGSLSIMAFLEKVGFGLSTREEMHVGSFTLEFLAIPP